MMQPSMLVVVVLMSLSGAVTLHGGLAEAADPSCDTGIIADDLCCAQECGVCGGQGCGSRPGGSADCCRGSIESSGRHCDKYGPPCIISPTPTPPSPSPSAATISLDTDTVYANVDPRFVSFTFDSSAWRKLDLSGKNGATGWGLTLDVLVAGLQPSYLRVGGTQGDYDIYTGLPGFPAGNACRQLPTPMTNYRCQEVNTTQMETLLSFVARNDLKLVYGLNDMYGRPTKTKPEKPLCTTSSCPLRNQSNIAAHLKWITSSKPAGWDFIYGYELGNELNSCLNGQAGALSQAMDFQALRDLVSQSWPTATSPVLIGPDTHSNTEFSTNGVAWFKNFTTAAGTNVVHHTFHMYSLGNGPALDPNKLDQSYLSVESLDKCGDGVKAIQTALPAGQSASLWAGETAAANDGGQSGITDTYIDGFWYLDQLGQLAALNVSVFCRQTMVATGGYPLVLLANQSSKAVPEPLPDYFVAVLHKKLMGQKVLKVSSDTSNVRVYVHCSLGSGDGGSGIAMAFLNIALNQTVTVTLPAELAELPTREEYFLTAGRPIVGAKNPLQSKFVLLNGQELSLSKDNNGNPALPDLPGKVVQQSTSSKVLLEASTYGFIRWPQAKIAACA